MSKRKSLSIQCPNCGNSFANGRPMTTHLLSCQSMLTTWDSFPQGKQNNELIASQDKIQKTIHQQLKIA